MYIVGYEQDIHPPRQGKIPVMSEASSETQGEPRVWIVNVAGHDYSAAKEHGELRRITDGYVSRGSLDRMLWSVVQGLKDSSAHDWLLPAGMLPLNAIAVSVWLRMHGTLRMLIYNSKHKDYDPLIITPERIDDLLNPPPKGDDAGHRDEETPRRGSS